MSHYFQKENGDCDFPIDLVYTWVDDTDPKWSEKKAAYQKAATGAVAGLSKSRFANHNELKYSLRSVAEYMPWIHHIYIVTDHQVPLFLNLDNPKVSVVDHAEIYDDLSVLPIFNSRSIECRLPFIPGLSEHFIYANDDTLLARPVNPSFFFTPNGLPIVRVHRHPFGKDPKWYENAHYETLIAPRLPWDWEVTIANVDKLIYDYYGKSYPYLPYHGMDPYRKSFFREVLQEPFLQTKVQETLRSRFRNEKVFQRHIIALMDNLKGRNQLILAKEYSKSEGACENFFVSDMDSACLLQREAQPYLFCVSAENEDFTKVIPHFLYHVFPKLCEYEKTPEQMKTELSELLVRRDITPAFAEDNIPVVFAVDENCADALSVLLKSIARRLKGNLDALVISKNLPQKSMDFITKKLIPFRNAKVRFVDICRYTVFSDFSLLAKNCRDSLAENFRLLAPEIFVNYDKLLYLDTDSICWGDLAELFRADLGECYFGGVFDDTGFAEASGNASYKSFAESYGFSDFSEYVNGGVLLLNAKVFREHALLDRQLQLIREDEWRNPVQDALNFICCGHIKMLDAKWNVRLDSHSARGRDLPEDTCICHFTGKMKPWENPSRPFARLWWNECDEEACGLFLKKNEFRTALQKLEDFSKALKEISQDLRRTQKKHKKYRRLFNITLFVAIVLSVLLLSLLLYIWLMK